MQLTGNIINDLSLFCLKLILIIFPLFLVMTVLVMNIHSCSKWSNLEDPGVLGVRGIDFVGDVSFHAPMKNFHLLLRTLQ